MMRSGVVSVQKVRKSERKKYEQGRNEKPELFGHKHSGKAEKTERIRECPIGAYRKAHLVDGQKQWADRLGCTHFFPHY